MACGGTRTHGGHVTCTINYKVKGGLPVGTYRVELFIDDKLTDTVRYNVAP